MFSIQVDELLDEIHVFHCFHYSDGSGMISASELGNIFRALNINVNNSQLNQLVKQMDENGSGMFVEMIVHLFVNDAFSRTS